MTSQPMPSSFDENKEYQETGFQKVARKLREEPLIPLGTVLTCLAFINAWRAMRRGDHARVQRMFRARVGAQAFTVVAMVAGGAYYGADREKRRELIKLEAQQRAEERNQKWLRELEVRDEEDKKLQAAVKRKRERLEQKRAASAAAAADGQGTAASSDTAAAAGGNADAGADAPPKKDEGSSGGVLGALSSVGGYFWSSKTPAPTPAPTSAPTSAAPAPAPAQQSKTDADADAKSQNK
ncbi:putative altered inheritance-mitochondria protein mitochondrial [Rosellinia necatrix]|uniref:Putative altered inheritance-mitochondria protein mitochondrial n=1 Tax=Rosellinia necatrix TaxID=77044 RepID=A0A1W2TSS1_ROSNE|nr:putative altered inheritance-mitochondria protein mitochondrial [Rosellinia necatrix]